MFAFLPGLLALLALPVVVVLHRFRRRFHRRTVSATFLWAPRDRASTAGRRQVPLYRSPSFWLELLAALLLALMLAQPRGCGDRSVTHAVIVLDGSASMAAAPSGSAIAAAAIARARRQIRLLPRSGRVTLIQSGTRPDLLAGPGAPRDEALIALDNYQPAALRHDLRAAVALGWEMSNGGAVTVITDTFLPERWPDAVTLIALGEPADNVAITSASRVRRGAQGDQVFLTVRSHAVLPVEAALTLSAPAAALHREVLALQPGERRSIAVSVPEGVGVITADLVAPDDALTLDNKIALAPPPPRVLGIAVALPEGLGQTLGLGEHGERWGSLLADSVVVPAPGAHLLIADALKASGPNTWQMILSAEKEETTTFIGPFLIERGHPLLDGVTLQGVLWSGAPGPMPGTPLISAGDQPLLTEEITDTGQRWYRLNLDVRRSNLHHAPDWPILLSNLAAMRRASLPGPQQTNLLVGEPFVYVDPEPGAWTWTGPGEERAVAVVDDLVVDGLHRPGVYTVQRDGEEVAVVAVRFMDDAESDLSGLGEGEQQTSVSTAALQASATPLDSVLLIGALVLLCLDWWVLWREAQGTALPEER